MTASLRIKILLITCATVAGALAVSGATTYKIVQANTVASSEANLTAIANGSALTIAQWVQAKAHAVEATAASVTAADMARAVTQMGQTNGFPICTLGWSDKTFFSTSGLASTDFDPTVRPWYVAAISASGVTITKPYGHVTTNVPYVAFTAPILRDGKAVGVLSGAVTLDDVRATVSAIHPTPSSFAFVVARDGQIIAHPDTAFSLKPSTDIASELTPALLATLAGSFEPQRVRIGGEDKLLKVRAVKGSYWYLVVALDLKEATSGLRKMLNTLIGGMILLMLATLVISSLFTSHSFQRLQQVRNAMNVVASGTGDLTHRLPDSGNDEVAQISRAFNGFVDKIEALLFQMRTGVETMRMATGEIETGNRDLSLRTEISASGLQETSAALTELTASVKQSVEATIDAGRLASSTSSIAQRGGDVMLQVVSTMEEIARSSKSVTEIIGVIDSIAFQTNILALNAAVEAARAGENGRGFAVVAAEVRTLAQRSATAAREIKGLIEASAANVMEGTQRVETAGVTMSEIVVAISRVAGIVGQVQHALNEQSLGITQIDSSIADMDRATQENAALVEQSAAASSQLNEQAQDLFKMIALFKLREAKRTE
ncbi:MULTISPECIES: methyl-accepting chemotaxis protein [unclassified Herbaspirillum]|uniref:methyl-accepting chemotaxis protein n=1 Tax=unclassified Herbaspirillum TaxID=2624150 RepID=UPI000E2F1FCC|nr:MULTISPECIES: methyl-accepting chemotaxis protein [unclassified Herbaspirillum]RFB71324.1 methyl-accepting chemotaxis protein [Herbaspirillum sp. 3R-3a1]TFI09115.1 methyl-accepting chemotaxis protein [Herbaspirillum sp. 3R11]TFI15533.1 methyl-accepting chemotaxis protein [Herbaspirillum sp. 3R-11]TFI32053.1 methyl-accepting chemotaxis protein [Herbaspirillum sp. 3C11]TFI32062.1 methyl-accepting chemotaxis protein [Herbaspirillum sp. 3C11]